MTTQVFGIFGWPVGHSLSPAMHNAAFAELGIDARYLPFAVRPEHLKDALCGVRALGISGINLTLPHKQRAIAELDSLSPDAAAVGAVNTIAARTDATGVIRLEGHNTDANGVVEALREAGAELRNMRVVVLGAGGAARAAVVGLATAGAAQITVAARQSAQAAELVHQLQPHFPTAVVVAAPFDGTLSTVFSAADLLIHATSATLAADATTTAAFVAALPLHCLPKNAIVNDLVYTPRQTSILLAANALGLRTVDGLGMLLHQGAAAFELWTGHPAPLRVMRQALFEALAHPPA